MGHVDLIVSLRCPREVALERYLGRRDPTRPAGDEALFAKRFAQFEEENPKILEFYDRENPRHTVEVSICFISPRGVGLMRKMAGSDGTWGLSLTTFFSSYRSMWDQPRGSITITRTL